MLIPLELGSRLAHDMTAIVCHQRMYGMLLHYLYPVQYLIILQDLLNNASTTIALFTTSLACDTGRVGR